MEQSEKYVVLATGGKQLTVAVGDTISVEKVSGAVGDSISFSDIMLVKNGENDLKIGKPYVEGASVTAKILGESKDDKVIIFKKKRRQGHHKRQGHRQQKTTLLVEAINS